MSENSNIVLVMGTPNSGKTFSLRKMRSQSTMVYLNTDLKATPFKNDFLLDVKVDDAADVIDYIKQIEANEQATGGVLDTLTFLMTMYERQYVAPHAGSKYGQQAWGAYANFYGDFIHEIKAGTKDYAILAHADTVLNEQKGEYETKVPVKGSVGRTGVEGDFTTILTAKQMPLTKLKGHENDLLTITPEEEEDGIKFVFCTRVTKDSLGEKSRSPHGLWKREELYIDNDLDQVFQRLREYYG